MVLENEGWVIKWLSVKATITVCAKVFVGIDKLKRYPYNYIIAMK
jgi:hypothetical protein